MSILLKEQIFELAILTYILLNSKYEFMLPLHQVMDKNLILNLQ